MPESLKQEKCHIYLLSSVLYTVPLTVFRVKEISYSFRWFLEGKTYRELPHLDLPEMISANNFPLSVMEDRIWSTQPFIKCR